MFVWTGSVLGGPTKCTFHYLLKGCLSCIHFNSDVQQLFFFFIIVFVVPHVNERTHESKLVC